MGIQEKQNEHGEFNARFLKWTEKLAKMEEFNKANDKIKAPDNLIKVEGFNKAKRVIKMMDNIIKDKAEEFINSAKTAENPDKHNTVDTEPLKTERTEQRRMDRRRAEQRRMDRRKAEQRSIV